MAETSSTEEDHNHIPIEIISDDEMALIEAAFAFASTRTFSSLRSSSSSKLPLCTNALSITPLSKRKLSSDIEDLPTCKKKHTLSDSFLHRFRNKRGLSVTDLTSTVSIMFRFLLVGLSRMRNFMRFVEIGLMRN